MGRLTNRAGHFSGPPDRHPPRWTDWLLSHFCPEGLEDELQGDLLEMYAYWVKTVGVSRARWRYMLAVLRLIRPFSKLMTSQSNEYFPPSNLNPTMLRNYVKIAFRNLVKNKTFSTINILGLALGMTCSLLIFLWIQDERSVDNYHANGPQLYNVMERQFYDGKIVAHGSTPGLLPDELKKQFPEVVYAAGFTVWDANMSFAVGNKAAKETGRWAGADWFKMYSIPLLAGTPEAALNAPNNLAISRKVAAAYFGTPEQAIGKSIRIDNDKDYQVTAVFENLPNNASTKYDFLLNWDDCLARRPWMKEWGNNAPNTHIMLRPDANVANLEAKLRFLMRKLDKQMNPKEFDIQLFLQPYQEAYLYSSFENGQQSGGRIDYVRLFGIVAVFLLLIACINFMNLATARSARRAREVGVRKVVGARRGLLVGQFIGEALLLTVLALVIALGLVYVFLPAFNSLTGKQVVLHLTNGGFGLMLLGMTLITGIVAGSYPALFLSSLNPVRVLKGSLKFGSGARLFRQGLVVFQFVLSMLLIVGTIVVYRQVKYVQTKNLGYDRENLIYMPADGELSTQYETFKEELLRMPGIQTVSYMGDLPINLVSSTGGVNWPAKDPNINIQFTQTSVGYDFAKTLRVKIKGRDFSKEYGTDSTNYLINEAAVKRIGYKDPVGQPLTMWGKPGKIIGVMEDFHFQSLHEPIQPLILRLAPTANRQSILIRTQPGQTQQALASLESLAKQMNPKFPFTYQFADSEYENLYRSEAVVGSLANYFAFLAIFISCLGLFGLSAFTAEQRTKEIGVRKVLGASVPNIIGLLSQDFLKLVLIAILIASPLAWWALNQWLQGFAYKLPITWWIFALAGLLAVGIALLTVSFQSIKAALMNPVKSLRSE